MFLFLGEPTYEIGGKLRHFMSAEDFFNRTVSANWATLDPTVGEAKGSFETWVKNVTNGDPIPGYMMEGSEKSVVTFEWQWWTADANLDIESSFCPYKGVLQC